MASELIELDASDLLKGYVERTFSPVEVVEACLNRIEETDHELKAVVTGTGSAAREQAKSSERRYLAKTARPLEGVPYGLKDIVATAGTRTTGASVIYGEYVPDVSATVHTRIDEAGGVLLGKLNTFPFALGSESDETFGPARNPWDVQRTTGGSSAGSAAAIAARQMPLAIGTDTGGSIRLPASWCGISGLKPTTGRVPTTGVMPLAWSLDTVGPMARSAEDLARLLGVVAGADGVDHGAYDAPVPEYVRALSDGIAGLRFAVPAPWFQERCDPDVVAATEAAAEVFAQLGAERVEVALPKVPLSMAMGWTVMLAELGSAHECHLDRIDAFDPSFAAYLRQSDFVTAHEYLRCMRARAVLQQDFARAFEDVDVLVVPAVGAVAPPLDGMTVEIGDETAGWLEIAARNTFVFNLTGMPALTIPAGLGRQGLPIGVQVAAAPWREDLCLRFGHAFQQATAFHRQSPGDPMPDDPTPGALTPGDLTAVHRATDNDRLEGEAS